ncbi:MAG: hypothetical protein QHG94_08575 [Candidatus Methanosuratincola sp.]|nr:hypothetical protein [Candidatus Methanosuratincola sp.]
MAPQLKGGIRGISPIYLSHIEKLTSAFEECIMADRCIEALNVLRLMDALAIGDDVHELLEDYTATKNRVMELANPLRWQEENDVFAAQQMGIASAKGLLIEHLQKIYQKLHARDAFIHETYYFEGGIPG